MSVIPKNVNFSQGRVFGPFLAIWLNDILTHPENKKYFISQKIPFQETCFIGVNLNQSALNTMYNSNIPIPYIQNKTPCK